MAPKMERHPPPWEASVISPGSWFRPGVQNLRTHMHLYYANTPSPSIGRQTYMHRTFSSTSVRFGWCCTSSPLLNPCPRSSAAR